MLVCVLAAHTIEHVVVYAGIKFISVAKAPRTQQMETILIPELLCGQSCEATDALCRDWGQHEDHHLFVDLEFAQKVALGSIAPTADELQRIGKTLFQEPSEYWECFVQPLYAVFVEDPRVTSVEDALSKFPSYIDTAQFCQDVKDTQEEEEEKTRLSGQQQQERIKFGVSAYGRLFVLEVYIEL